MGEEAEVAGYIQRVQIATASALAEAFARIRVRTVRGDRLCRARARASTRTIFDPTLTITCVGGRCAGDSRRCAGPPADVDDVRACCSADHVCVQTNANRANCVPATSLPARPIIRTCIGDVEIGAQ